MDKSAKQIIFFNETSGKQGFQEVMAQEKNHANQYNPYVLLQESKTLTETLKRNEKAAKEKY